MTAQRRRSGGRADRLAQRAAGPVNPCPPGQHSGRYKPLGDTEIAAIYDTALRLLEELGMGDVPDRLAEDLRRAGAEDRGDGRLRFPRALVEDAIAQAAKTFPLHARDAARSIEIGGDRVYFGTGGAAVQTLDLETGLYR
ncbi:MAG: trimethylamine methyltransferase family protein, partial [Pseudomonadota bacterium]